MENCRGRVVDELMALRVPLCTLRNPENDFQVGKKIDDKFRRRVLVQLRVVCTTLVPLQKVVGKILEFLLGRWVRTR